MSNVVILYAPEKNAIKEQAKAMAQAIDGKEFAVTVKSAAKSHIPDLAAADIMIFGSREENAAESESEYREILRACEGVNFAGKVAAIAGKTGSSFDSQLKKILSDTDAAVFQQVFELSDREVNKKAVTDWAKKLYAFFKDYRSARNV